MPEKLAARRQLRNARALKRRWSGRNGPPAGRPRDCYVAGPQSSSPTSTSTSSTTSSFAAFAPFLPCLSLAQMFRRWVAATLPPPIHVAATRTTRVASIPRVANPCPTGGQGGIPLGGVPPLPPRCMWLATMRGRRPFAINPTLRVAAIPPPPLFYDWVLRHRRRSTLKPPQD